VALATGSAIAAALLVGLALTSWQAVRAKNAESIANANELAARTAEADAVRERDNVASANEKLSRTMDLQRKTRYAAEMNLAQAAFNDNDMAQVKKVLMAQVPKHGEPDDRGPEWHYWDRRLNDFVKEFNLPIFQGSGGGLRVSAAFSPDGGRLAHMS